MGMTDGTTHYSCGFNSRHGQATSQNHSRQQDDPLILLRTNNANNYGYATFDSFITDGVRIDWSTDPPPNAVTVTCVLIKADNAKVIEVTNTGTEDATLNVTGLGFTPSFGWAMTSHPSVSSVSAGGSTGDNARFCVGILKWTAADTCQQVSFAFGEDDATAEGNPFAKSSINRGIITLDDESTSGTELQFGNRDSDGFDVTTRNGSDSFSTFVLAAELGDDADNTLGIENGPTSTGDWDITGYTYEPSFVMILQNGLESYGTLTANNSQPGIGGVYVADDTTESSTGWVVEDNSATTDTGSISYEGFYQLEHDGTAGYAGTLSSFNSDGFTINMATAVPSTGPKFLIWSIADPVTTVEETLTTVSAEATQNDLTESREREMTLTGVNAEAGLNDLTESRAREMVLTLLAADATLYDLTITDKAREMILTGVAADASQEDIVESRVRSEAITTVSAEADQLNVTHSWAKTLTITTITAEVSTPDIQATTAAIAALTTVSAEVSTPDITRTYGREITFDPVIVWATQNDIFLRQAQTLETVSADVSLGDITQGYGEYESLTSIRALASQGDVTQGKVREETLETVSASASQGGILSGRVGAIEQLQAVVDLGDITLTAERSLETVICKAAVFDVAANGVVALTPLSAEAFQGDIGQAQAIDITPVGAIVNTPDIVIPLTGAVHEIQTIRAVVSLGNLVDYEFFVSNAQRIYRTLYSLLEEGPYYQVNYDTKGEQTVVLPAVHVAPGSIALNEVDSEFGDSRNKQKLRFAKTVWSWVAYIDFHVPVVLDAFEDKMLKSPVNIPRDNNNVLDPVIVEFNRATYRHGAFQGPEAGTQYELSFFATPLEG